MLNVGVLGIGSLTEPQMMMASRVVKNHLVIRNARVLWVP